MKTADLTDTPLDWAVAKALGMKSNGVWLIDDQGNGYLLRPHFDGMSRLWAPSSLWEQAGPIILREQISIGSPGSRVHRHGGNQPGWGASGIWTAATWHAGVDGRRNIASHESSPLIAAMRCYVASKIGDEVEIPGGLS